MSVYILVKIDDEYGHRDFIEGFMTREAGEAYAKEYFPYLKELGDLYPSLEEFEKKNGCVGYVLFEYKLK